MSSSNCPVCGRPYYEHSERQSEICAEENARR
jgi:hypothetical protein